MDLWTIGLVAGVGGIAVVLFWLRSLRKQSLDSAPDAVLKQQTGGEAQPKVLLPEEENGPKSGREE